MFSIRVKHYKLSSSESEFLDSLAANGVKKLQFHFGEVLFIRQDEQLVAIHNKCPHQGKPMEGCEIQEGAVICPWHKYRFNLETGRGHGLYLERYQLEENENGFFLLRSYFSWFGE